MEKTQKIKTANLLRNIARYTLFVLGILVLVFALLSGANEYGGGIRGIIRNSPNALPWLVLLALIIVARKWELVGGIIITLFGLAALYFFIFKGNHFFVSTFILTLLIIMLGSFFIVSWYLRKEEPV
ncbi:MAG: hypothetical protein GXO83_06675 [Chlorobi bacterium]|nr:hypothetical protein [Chlorobiota bacterium]